LRCRDRPYRRQQAASFAHTDSHSLVLAPSEPLTACYGCAACNHGAV
jgi:hypothetical protein